MAATVPETTLLCPRCRRELPLQRGIAGESICTCGAKLEVAVFPAFNRSLQPGQSGQALVDESESGCFYHPQKRAVVPCSACGRFLCALCDLELNGQHLCPPCLSGSQRKGKMPELERERILYDNVALIMAVAPIAIFPFTFLTAPAAVIMAIMWWKKPASILPRTRIRFIFAITIGLLQIAGWCALFAFMRVR